MKLYLQQLTQHLNKQLMPVYLISGDIPTLKEETVTSIYNAAKTKGYTDQLSYSMNDQFDWETFNGTLKNFSLLGEKQLIVLHANTTRLGLTGGKIIKHYLESPDKNKLLLILTPKLDASAQKTTWVKSIIKSGAHVPIWDIDPARYPQWLSTKLAEKNLRTNQEGLKLLAQYTEGNTTSGIQAIEKLALAFNQGSITAQDISSIITHHQQFDLFKWTDACLIGDIPRIILIFNTLKSEGVEPAIMLWGLTQEIRKLIHLTVTIQQGEPLQACFKKLKIWDKKIPLFQRALACHHQRTLESLLISASQIDHMIKGINQGNSFDHLLQLGLALGGLKTP